MATENRTLREVRPLRWTACRAYEATTFAPAALVSAAAFWDSSSARARRSNCGIFIASTASACAMIILIVDSVRYVSNSGSLAALTRAEPRGQMVDHQRRDGSDRHTH